MGLVYPSTRMFAGTVQGVALYQGSEQVWPAEMSTIIGWWKLDETTGTVAADEIGDYPGTYVGSPTLAAAGIDGTAVTLDGVDDFVDIGTLGQLGSSLPGTTFECWVKTIQMTRAAIIGQVGPATASYTIRTNAIGTGDNPNSGATSLVVRDHTGGSRTQVTYDLAYDDRWHHLVVVHRATATAQLYVDGWLASGSGSWTMDQYDWDDWTTPLALGALNNLGTMQWFFAGSLDNVVWHNRELTAAEVQERYTLVSGDPVPYSENWSWWTRPRAVAYDGYLYALPTYNEAETGLSIWNGATGDKTQMPLANLVANDDHNNGAIIANTGKPMVVFYCRHNDPDGLRYRIGTENVEDIVAGTPGFGTEDIIDFGTTVSYAVAHVHGNDLYASCRRGTGSWGLAKSTDWGQTWTTYSLAQSTDGRQCYMASVVAGDTLRCLMGNHPINGVGVQTVHYFEVDLLSGDITKADGTVIGSLGTAIDHTDGDLVFTPQAGYNQWVYDVGDGANPEVTFLEFDNDNQETTGTYYYGVYAGGVWDVNPVIASGKRMNAGGSDGEPYYSGIHMKRGVSTAGTVFLSRHDGTSWKYEKHVTTDDGATWTITTIDAPTLTNGSALYRCFPIEGDTASVPWDHVGIHGVRWGSYTSWRSYIKLMVDP